MALSNLQAWIRRRWIPLIAVGSITIGPPAIVLIDYMGEIRQAALIAEGTALVLAESHFRGPAHVNFISRRRLRGQLLRLRRSMSQLMSVSTQHPPRAGAYASYAHGVRVTVRWRWQPIGASLIGGPYVIRASATAAVLPTEDGKWMVLRVE